MQQIFLFPEQSSLKSFWRYSSLEKHLHFENRNYVLEYETLYDKALNKTGRRVQKKTESTESDGLPESNTGPQLQMDLALKTSSKRQRYFDILKKFLFNAFDAIYIFLKFIMNNS